MNLLQASLRNIVFSMLLLPLVFSVVLAAEAVPAAVAPQVAGGTIQDPVARVNGREITAAQLQRAVDALLATEPWAKLSPEALKNVNFNVLEGLISRELIYQAGMKLEIKDLDRQVREKIAQEKGRISLGDFENELRSKGLTEKEWGDGIRRDIVVGNFVSKTIDAKISVTDEECKKVYDQNIDKFTQPEQVRASHILIGTATMSVDEKKKAREKAEELRKQLVDGSGGFADLARKYSSAPDSKMGGDMGFVTRGQMPESFASKVFALKPGQLSEVVETRAGYDIIKMRDRRPSVTASFDKAKPQIEEYLKKQKTDMAVQEFVQEARRNSKVEVLIK